jgi:hypothetical protein
MCSPGSFLAKLLRASSPMRTPCGFLFVPLLIVSAAQSAETPSKPLTPDSLPQFLTNYERNLIPLEGAYGEIENDPLPLYDENGQPLGHRPLEDRRKALADLRETLHQLSDKPRELRLALKLFFETEDLNDDLYDLAQIAYDNDREELGKRLADVVNALDLNRALIENYALALAEETEARVEELEKRNQKLEPPHKGPAKK